MEPTEIINATSVGSIELKKTNFVVIKVNGLVFQNERAIPVNVFTQFPARISHTLFDKQLL